MQNKLVRSIKWIFCQHLIFFLNNINKESKCKFASKNFKNSEIYASSIYSKQLMKCFLTINYEGN